MKRPKTAIDVAMEQSPVKARFLVSELVRCVIYLAEFDERRSHG